MNKYRRSLLIKGIIMFLLGFVAAFFRKELDFGVLPPESGVLGGFACGVLTTAGAFFVTLALSPEKIINGLTSKE